MKPNILILDAPQDVDINNIECNVEVRSSVELPLQAIYWAHVILKFRVSHGYIYTISTQKNVINGKKYYKEDPNYNEALTEIANEITGAN